MKKPQQVLAVVGLAVFLSILDLFIVNIAFPDLRRDFPGVDLSGLSWVLTAYAILFVYAANLDEVLPAGSATFMGAAASSSSASPSSHSARGYARSRRRWRRSWRRAWSRASGPRR